MTVGGDVQVVNGSNTVLWHSGSSAPCSTSSSCNLTLQNDGNLVLYQNGQYVWDSATYNKGAAILTLSSQAPYIMIVNTAMQVVWPTTQATVPTQMFSTSRSPAQAYPVQSFLGSMAINSHAAQNGYDATTMMTMLNYLGVYSIRDGYNAGLQGTYQTMAKAGVQFDVGIGDPTVAGALAGPEAIAAMAPGALVAVEGPNEINNGSFTVNGVTSQSGWPNNAGPLAQSYMTQLFKIVHADSLLKDVVVYDLTWGGTTNAEQYGMLDLTNQADFGNIHFYPNGQPYQDLQLSLAALYHQVLPNQVVMTETGFSTNTGWVKNDSPVMTETAQAILDINLYLDGFLQGVQKTYIYELYDEWQGYGLFKNQQSNFAPKQAATAIHNLTTILADTHCNSLTPGKLNFSIPGLPNTAHTLLLQKSTGVFDLIIWNEVPITTNGNDVSVTPLNLTVQLGANFSKVSIYNPIAGSNPQQTLNGTSTVNLGLGGAPLIVEVVP